MSWGLSYTNCLNLHFCTRFTPFGENSVPQNASCGARILLGDVVGREKKPVPGALSSACMWSRDMVLDLEALTSAEMTRGARYRWTPFYPFTPVEKQLPWDWQLQFLFWGANTPHCPGHISLPLRA